MKKSKKIFSKTVATVLALSMITACGVPTTETPSEAPTESAAATEATTDAASSDEPITLEIVDWSDSTRIQRDEFHKKFMEENPNVTIEYTMVTQDQFKNTALTAIKSGDGPDIFPVPNGMKLGVAVNENWFLPLEDYVTPEFLATINPNNINEGYQKVDDVLYVLPENVGIPSSFLYYNKDILAAAGYDETNYPKSYAEFLECSQKITETGAGEYYAIIEGGNQLQRWETTARGWAALAGGYAGKPNSVVLKDGRAIYDRPEMVAVVDLFKSLGENGVYHPDSLNISAPEARAMFAQGQAGFLIQGIWSSATWDRENPDFNYGVMPIPTPDGAPPKGAVAAETPGSWMGISSTCENPEMAGKYIMELYGEEYQGACVAGGGFVSIVDAYNDKYMPEGATKEYYDIAEKYSKVVPDPLLIDTKVGDFYAEVKDVQPSLGAIMQGAVAGSIPDVQAALTQLADASTAEWTRAAEAVGLDVSVFEFPNWDQTQDFTEDMYPTE